MTPGLFSNAWKSVVGSGQASSQVQDPTDIGDTQDETREKDWSRASNDNLGTRVKSAAAQEQGVHVETGNEGRTEQRTLRGTKEEQLQAVERCTAAQMKQQIEELTRRLENAERQKRDMNRRIERQESEIRTLQNEASRERREKQQLQAARGDLDATAKRMQQQIDDLTKRVTSAQQQNNDLDQRLQRQTNEIRILHDGARQAETKHLQTVKLLEARATELKGAQAFLTKADLLSGADVITMVESLNSEIFQASALMADTLKCGYQPMATEEVERMAAQTSGILGNRMVHLLRSKQPDSDPMLLQIALQACMVKFCRWMTSSWNLYDQRCHEILTMTYARIQETEDQPVSGRWRALTRAHVNHPPHRDSQKFLMSNFIDHLFCLLVVAGWSETPSRARDTFTRRFGEKLSVIGKLAIQLNKAIGEDITSGDLEAIAVHPDAVFDPATMVDAYTNERPRKGENPVKDLELVVSTTDMGLQRVARRLGEGKNECELVVVLKPKVVLYSALEHVGNVEGVT